MARANEYALQQAQARATINPRTGAYFKSYYELRTFRAQERGFRNVAEQTAYRTQAQRDLMFQRFAEIMRGHGKTRETILQEYIGMKQANAGRQPTRNDIRNTLDYYGYYEEADDYTPYPEEA